jgi:hypothetical protein
MFGAIGAFFSSGRAAQQAQRALELVAAVRPHIIRAADLAVTLTPSPADNAAWAAIKERYPRLLSGQHRTGDEIKADALIIATEIIRARFPGLTTTEARLAAQQGYLDWRASQ